MTARVLTSLLTATALWTAASCQDAVAPVPFTENYDITVCGPTNAGFSLTIDNPFFPMPVGTQWTLQGNDGGDAVELVITILPDTEMVAGVATRVLEERESENGTLLEVSRNFFVQAATGDICYYGEDVDIYRNGVIVSHDGAWRAGVANATPGVFMPATPAVGQMFRQEVAPGVAEDRIEVTAVGDTVTVPFGTYGNTVRFLESTPLEPGARSYKAFASGIGMIVDDVVRLVSKTP
jgi:hypothetical protein